MKLTIKHQDSYSRGELLLRTFFGWLYICIPHFVVMIFVGIWAAILGLLSFFAVLFTGKYPKAWFEFQVKLINWGTRLNSTLYNLIDGYPAIGVGGTSDRANVTVPYPEKINQGLVILRLLFGWLYVGIPHGFCLFFRMIAAGFICFLAWWVVLFTGTYPASWHSFMAGTFRWMLKIKLYLGYMSDEYPKFSGKE